MKVIELLLMIGLLAQAASGQAVAQVFEQTFRAGWMFPDDDRRRVESVADVATPHISWAKPFAGGPLRVLMVATGGNGRWPVELAQRFDFHIKVVYAVTRDQFGSKDERKIAQSEIDVEARLLQAMDKSIAVFVSEVPIGVLGEKVRARLMKLLEQGVGYVGPVDNLDLGNRKQVVSDAQALVASAAPVSGLPNLSNTGGTAEKAASPLVSLWDASKAGRIATVRDFRPDSEGPPADRLQYLWLSRMADEAWYSLTARAILWSARRVPAKSLVRVSWPEKSIDRSAMPYRLPVAAENSPQMTFRIWDADGQLRHEGAIPQVPPLPSGRYFGGVQALNGSVQDWAFGTFSVHNDVEITSVELDGKYQDQNRPVRVRVRLSQSAPEGYRLVLDILDNYGRSVSLTQTKAEVDAELQGDPRESSHLYNYANVRLMNPSGRVVSEKRQAFYVNRTPGTHEVADPPADELNCMLWGGGSFHPSVQAYLRRYAELGIVNGLLAGHTRGDVKTEDMEAGAIMNFHPVVYVTRMGAAVVRDGVRMPCLSNPGYHESLKGTLARQAAVFKNFAPLTYSLGDDQHLVAHGEDVCWSPTCRAGLARWAQTHYGSLENVNRAWRTSFSSLEQVEPIRLADALKAVHGETPNYGPFCRWADNQDYLADLVVRWHETMVQGIHAEDRSAPVGVDSTTEGWVRPGSGIDFWQLMNHTSFFCQYPNPIVQEILASVDKKPKIRGLWFGGYGLYQYPPQYYDETFLPWWAVFRGINLMALFHSMAGDTMENISWELLAPDLGAYEGMQVIFDNVRELKGGIAKLLFNAQRTTDGIAVVYSPSSVNCVAALKPLPQAPQWSTLASGDHEYFYMQAWEALTSLLSDSGLSYDVIHEQTLRNAEDLKRFKVLVIPMALHLDRAQAAGIREFVSSGGLLLSDAFAGVFGQQYRADQPGMIADVLGVDFPGGVPGPRVAMEPAVVLNGPELGQLAADGGIVVKGAVPSGKTASGIPILLQNRFGKGEAIYLNLLVRDYQIRRTLSTQLPILETMGRLLASHGLKPAVRVEIKNPPKQVHPLLATEIHRYRLGGAEYVGFLRHAKLRSDETVFMSDLRAKPVQVHLDRAAHVYDVRTRTYRGFRDNFDDVSYPGKAEFFALLPYEVTNLKLSPRTDPGTLNVQGLIETGSAKAELATHVFHLEIVDPAGRMHHELTRNIVGPKGSFNERIFVGHNAQPGTWQLTVRDVASGMQRRANVKF